MLRSIDVIVDTPQCKPTRVAGLKVYPPDQYDAGHARRDLDACTASGRTFLTVQPVQPGVGARP